MDKNIRSEKIFSAHQERLKSVDLAKSGRERKILEEKIVSIENPELSQEKLDLLTRQAKQREEELFDNKVLKERWKLFRKLYNVFFVIENPALDVMGVCPNFEKEVLYDNYQKLSFTRPCLFWERVYRETRPLYHSVSVKKRVKFSEVTVDDSLSSS